VGQDGGCYYYSEKINTTPCACSFAGNENLRDKPHPKFLGRAQQEGINEAGWVFVEPVAFAGIDTLLFTLLEFNYPM